ncbi:MAG: helicase-related protein, partial [Caldilineaceae bacterium]
SVDVVVGTTAIIQDGVEFAALGLVVVDEQHRFGVEQRGALRTKSAQQPHLLAMSATPIPRSLALTVFGDLDLSILDEMPPGRWPVKTVLFRPSERERVYDFLKREAADGRQAFIVYPLVEESEVLEAGAATEAFERLQREVFPDLSLALLHGQMKGAEKDAIMSAFAAGTYDILVATTVIEVGIDVPNASVIIIEDADRFGLAQLHQLRGRVGRGGHKSFCVLVTRAEGDAAEERLRVLERTNNGFVLAEEDLRRRGPGEFLGKRQTGLPELQVAQFSDLATVEQARAAALRFFAQDPQLSQHEAIRQRVARFWRGEGDIS